MLVLARSSAIPESDPAACKIKGIKRLGWQLKHSPGFYDPLITHTVGWVDMMWEPDGETEDKHRHTEGKRRAHQQINM